MLPYLFLSFSSLSLSLCLSSFDEKSILGQEQENEGRKEREI